MSQSIIHGTCCHRTKSLPLPQAASFARCLRANGRFENVGLQESRSPGKFYVTFLPSSEERQIDLILAQTNARQERAETEGRSYCFVEDPDSTAFVHCLSTSGEVYSVSPFSCDCPDAAYRLKGSGIFCKHVHALRSAMERGEVRKF